MNNKFKREILSKIGLEPGALDLLDVRSDESPHAHYDGKPGISGNFNYSLLEDVPEVIFILTPKGILSYLTPAFSELTGWAREQWIGRPFSDLIDIEMRKDTLCELFKFENCRRKKVFETKILVNGGSIDAEISAAFRLRHGEAMSIIGSLRDNTDKIRSEEVHALQEKRIRALYEISAEPGMGIETQLVETLKAGAGLLSMEVAGVGRLTGKNCRVLYCYDEMGRVTQGLECELLKTYCKITLSNDDVVAMDHVRETEYRNEEFFRGYGFESYIGVPLRIDGTVFGTLNFASPHPRKEPFVKADKDFIRLMGRWISTMIERKKAEGMRSEKKNSFTGLSSKTRTTLY
ncbi:MAG: PAS domain-containing protein [Thermodesulfobacteriota bacterium]